MRIKIKNEKLKIKYKKISRVSLQEARPSSPVIASPVMLNLFQHLIISCHCEKRFVRLSAVAGRGNLTSSVIARRILPWQALFKNTKRVAILGSLIILLFSTFTFANSLITGERLNAEGEQHNGKIIAFQGEAIGDIMKRGEYAWVNLKEGDFLIGVWMTYKDAKKIKYIGRYGSKGDCLRIEGIYNENCPEHFGEKDIHAINVEIINEGSLDKEELDMGKIWLSFALGISTLIFIIHSRRVLRKEREQDSD